MPVMMRTAETSCARVFLQFYKRQLGLEAIADSYPDHVKVTHGGR